MKKKVSRGCSILTPGGTYMKTPPDHNAPWSAANLCSGGNTFMKYLCTRSGYRLTASSMGSITTPLSCNFFFKLK